MTRSLCDEYTDSGGLSKAALLERQAGILPQCLLAGIEYSSLFLFSAIFKVQISCQMHFILAENKRHH